MDTAYESANSFFKAYYFPILIVVVVLVCGALIRTNLNLVAFTGPTRAQYKLYETMVDEPKVAFCTAHSDLQARESQCNELSENVCKDAACCVWADTSYGHSACVAGDKHGPVYLSDPHSENLYDVTKYTHKGDVYSNRKATN